MYIIHKLLYSLQKKTIFCYSACPAGKYRSVSDTTCQQCPGNTVMDQEAAAQCECLDGYFRNDENRVTDPRAQPYLSPANEQPSTACTRELHM